MNLNEQLQEAYEAGRRQALSEQIVGPGGQHGPWDPYQFDPDMSHAPWFPWWLLPSGPNQGDAWEVGDGDSEQLQMMWNALTEAWPGLEKILRLTEFAGWDRIENMKAIIRFLLAPHLPSRIISGEIAWVLRQWMMENLNIVQEILGHLDPDTFGPMNPGGGGVYAPLGPSDELLGPQIQIRRPRPVRLDDIPLPASERW